LDDGTQLQLQAFHGRTRVIGKQSFLSDNTTQLTARLQGSQGGIVKSSLECSKPAEELTPYLAPYLIELALPLLQWVTARISGTQGGVLLLEEMRILSATVSIAREIFTKAHDGDGAFFVRSMLYTTDNQYS
jgi:hypothetical protein